MKTWDVIPTFQTESAFDIDAHLRDIFEPTKAKYEEEILQKVNADLERYKLVYSSWV